MWGGVGQGKQTYLTGDHEHGEDKDEASFGHREPAGLLQGEEYGSVQAGLCGAGGGSFCYREAPRSSGLFPSGPDPLLCLPTAGPSSHPRFSRVCGGKMPVWHRSGGVSLHSTGLTWPKERCGFPPWLLGGSLKALEMFCLIGVSLLTWGLWVIPVRNEVI